MTKIDLQVFTGIMTVQLILGGWFAEHPLGNWWLKFGFLPIDNYRHRKEVVETLENLSEALGLIIAGSFLPKKIAC